MKRFILTVGIAAVSIAFQGVNATETWEPPYEHSEFDRSSMRGTPYEDFKLERALPQFPERIQEAVNWSPPYEQSEFDRRSGSGVLEGAGTAAPSDAGSGDDALDRFNP